MYGLEGEASHVIDAVEDGDGKAAWEKLLERYDHGAAMSKMDLYMEIVHMGYTGFGSGEYEGTFADFITAFEAKYKRLVELGESIGEKVRIALLLNAIPKSWETIRETLELQIKEEDMTWERVTGIIKPAARRKECERGLKEVALKAVQSCFHCGREGHRKVDCPKRESPRCYHCKELGHKKSSCPKIQCTKCNERGHMRYQCEKSDQANRATETNSDTPSEVGWCCVSQNEAKKSEYAAIDSGANVHICPDAEIFISMVAVNGEKKISGLAKNLHVQGVGNIKMGQITLQNVRYVPEAAMTLISPRRLAREHGIGFRIDPDETGYLFTKDRSIRLEDVNDLYMFKNGGEEEIAMLVTESASDLALLHRRYAHMGCEKLAKTFGLKRQKLKCTTCMACKNTRKSVEKQRSRKLSNDVGDLVYIDIEGPGSSLGPQGEKYIIGFIDDFSKTLMTMAVKDRRFCAEHLKVVIAKFKSIGKPIKKIRVDRAKEFMSKEFVHVCTSEGITVERTPAYGPQYVGMIERRWGILLPMMRCMLVESGVPKSLWVEAMKQGTAILNRVPRDELGGKSPLEVATSRSQKEKLERIRVFGSLAFMKDEGRIDKFAGPNAIEGYVVGCSIDSPGYRVWNPHTGKISVRHHVEVNERILFCHRKYERTQGIPEWNVDTDTDTESESGEVDESSHVANLEGNTGNEQDNHEDISGQMDIWCNIDPRNIIEGSRNSQGMLATVPGSERAARSSPESDKWLEAEAAEMRSFSENGVLQEVETIPTGCAILDGKWVYTLKKDAEGNIQRYKARFVIRGCKQRQGEFHHTYAPVAEKDTLRMLMALTAKRGYVTANIDINTAYLNAPLEEKLFCVIKGKTYQLRKCVYGLKQAGHNWNVMIDQMIQNVLQMDRCPEDRCLYRNTGCYLLLYVDDVILVGETREAVTKMKSLIQKHFKTRDLGDLEWCLGIEMNQSGKTIKLSQKTYTQGLLEKHKMMDCKPAKTPGEEKEILTKNDREVINQGEYRELVGCLVYLSSTTRPDITNAVRAVAQHVQCPGKIHWRAVRRILRYLRGTIDLGISYSGMEKLIGYVDADFANEENRKSVGGYVLLLGGGPIAWNSKRQSIVTTSTAEAEYVALSNAGKIISRIRKILIFLGEDIKNLHIMEDNQAAINLVTGEKIPARTKHIDVKYHHVREMVRDRKEFEVKYVPTVDQMADIFTKNLGTTLFRKHRMKLMGE